MTGRIAVVPMAGPKNRRRARILTAVKEFESLVGNGQRPLMLTAETDYDNYKDLFEKVPQEARMSREGSKDTFHELMLIEKKLEENNIHNVTLITDIDGFPSIKRLKMMCHMF